MKYYVIIPAHNEEKFIAETLASVAQQTLVPKKVVVVNDNSTDRTADIITEFILKNPIFTSLTTTAAAEHMPGSKVISAFNKGLTVLDQDYDFIVKLDADVILPKNYFETIAASFANDSTLGIAGGFIYELTKSGTWQRNHPMDDSHVRGAFKAYSKACFKAINGLKPAMGWDTVDELLAQYHGYKTHTIEALQVKHLRPTGSAYNKKAKGLQGSAMYRMRYGFIISCIAALKMALKQRRWSSFGTTVRGYLHARKQQEPFLVSTQEGEFIRQLRWTNIRSKILP